MSGWSDLSETNIEREQLALTRAEVVREFLSTDGYSNIDMKYLAYREYCSEKGLSLRLVSTRNAYYQTKSRVIAKLGKQTTAMFKALIANAMTFEFYSKEHMLKGTPEGIKKARRNEDKCQELIAIIEKATGCKWEDIRGGME